MQHLLIKWILIDTVFLILYVLKQSANSLYILMGVTDFLRSVDDMYMTCQVIKHLL